MNRAQRPRRFVSLRTKFLWGSVLVVTVVMGALVVIVDQRQRAAIVREVQQRGLVLVRNLATISAEPLLLYNFTALEQNVGRLNAEADVVYAVIVDRDGNVVAHSRSPGMVGSALPDTLPAETAPTNSVVIREVIAPSRERLYDFTVPVLIRGDRWGAARVGLSRRRMDAEMAATRRRLAGLSAATLVVAALAAGLVAQRIARPVRQLAEWATAISQGDLAQRIEPSTSDEIGRLALAFNDMAGQLLEQRTALLEQRGALERANAELGRRFAELSDLKSYTDHILGSLTSGIITLDLEGRVVTVNEAAAAFLGVSPSEARDRPCAEVLARAPDLAGLLLQTLQTRTAVPTAALTLRHADGRVIPVEVSTATLKGGQGRDLGVVAVVRDLTALRQLEDQLRQAQKMEAVGQLAGGVAHDFNNLLTVITGRSQLLLGRLGRHDASRRDVDLIEKTAQRAAGLTRQLLAFSRKQILQPTVLNLSEIVAGMDSMLGRLIGEDIVLVSRLDAPAGWVRADRGQLEQVIANLVVNARDAMPYGGHLTLETASVDLDAAAARQQVGVRPGPYVRLTVRDTGVGMDADTKAHLFEPFFTTKGPGKGTGLGLATVYGIVAQSGGHIWAESELGEGATFTIDLPRVDAPTELRGADSTPSESAPGCETVLLVEDEAGVRDLAAEILRGEGYTVIEAANGDEALELANRHRQPIHLLVTDVVMPLRGGRELVDRLKTEHRETAVLYMTGYTDDVIIRQGVLGTETAFLEKPFTPDALARKVREVLGAPGNGPA